MADGLPANTNPFIVTISWEEGDVQLHEVSPIYFSYDGSAEMPFAKEVLRPPLTQKDAEKLVRSLIVKDQPVRFAVHERFAHIIPKDLKKIVRFARTYSASHSKEGFYVPCCTDDECYFLK